MRAPSRASISARRRGIVQLRRSATGSSSKGVAASLFTGGGPGAMLAFSAAMPPAGGRRPIVGLGRGCDLGRPSSAYLARLRGSRCTATRAQW